MQANGTCCCLHTGRKQHQRNCGQICAFASSVDWALVRELLFRKRRCGYTLILVQFESACFETVHNSNKLLFPISISTTHAQSSKNLQRKCPTHHWFQLSKWIKELLCLPFFPLTSFLFFFCLSLFWRFHTWCDLISVSSLLSLQMCSFLPFWPLTLRT